MKHLLACLAFSMLALAAVAQPVPTPPFVHMYAFVLSELAETCAGADYLILIDVDDTSQNAAGSAKRIRCDNLLGSGGGGDNTFVNGTATTDFNLVNSTDIVCTLSTAPDPDEIDCFVVDGSHNHIEANITDLGNYQVDLAVVPQAEAEAGTAATERIWTALRVAQAIAALETPPLSGGVGVDVTGSVISFDATELGPLTFNDGLSSSVTYDWNFLFQDPSLEINGSGAAGVFNFIGEVRIGGISVPTISSVNNLVGKNYISASTDAADTGVLRMGNNVESVCWEASPAGTDVCLSADASEIIQVSGGGFDAADLLVGTLPAARIADGSITNAKAADMPPNTIKLRASAGSGDPEDVLISALPDLPSPTTGDLLFGMTAAGALARVNVGNLPTGGGGEANTASNVGGGLANFDTKIGVDLRFNSFAGADFDLTANLFTIDAAIARDSELHSATTLSGAPDYITLSGQDLVRGLIDLAADVTGTLADANVANNLTLASATIGTSAITLVQSANPTPTAEGAIEWETDTNEIHVGDGVGTQVFVAGAHTTDTGPSPDCSGTTTYQDGEGGCDTLSAGTDITADLEEENHAAEHEGDGLDVVGETLVVDPSEIELGIQAETGVTYTFVLADQSKLITMDNPAANTVTIPLNAAVAFPVGSVSCVQQLGAGATTVVSSAGASINGIDPGSATIGVPYGEVCFTQLALDTWVTPAADAGLTAGRSLTRTGNILDADAELFTRISTLDVISPASYTNGHVQMKFPLGVTISRISCSTDVGSATIQFDERAEATPNSAGTDVMSAALVCDNNTEATTAFTNAGIAADVPFNLDIDATASTPGVVRIHIDYTVDE